MLNKNDLIDVLASGCKPKEQWRLGLEHEQFAYDKRNNMPLPYNSAPGIKQILEMLSSDRGWSGQKFDGEVLIALTKGSQSVTIEPAGQIELSGSPHKAIDEMVKEHQAFMKDLEYVSAKLDIGFFSKGFPPEWKRDDMHWMPKSRYKIMRHYMPTRGNLGLDMMTRTCGSQINLDFSSESDMVRKYRISLALQPFMIACFANSNILEGKDSGYSSYRAHIWDDTDPDRSGIPAFVFQDDMGFERYVDYALDVPMYFIERDGKLIDMSGKSFRDFMKGTLPESKDYEVEIKDWNDHLSTAFPEVRLKTYLEMRGTDSVDPPLLYSLAAFWAGLLYSDQSLDKCEEFIEGWSIGDHIEFRKQAVKHGIDGIVPKENHSIRDVMPSIIAIAREGLNTISQNNAAFYLDELLSVVTADVKSVCNI